MQFPDNWAQKIDKGIYDSQLRHIYSNRAGGQKQRYKKAVENFEKLFCGQREICIISAPGRVELVGNHTDHQHGRVLAAAIDMDMIAVCSKRSDCIINVHSQGFKPLSIDTRDTEKRQNETGTSAAIVRGIVNRFLHYGYCAGGLDAYIESEIPVGSGLSSSAAFEILIGSILNYLYNENAVDKLFVAQTGKYSENEYFLKPCGLMDQTACAIGGIIAVDFKNPAAPKIERVEYSFNESKHAIIVTDAKGSHADLLSEYASIIQEMKSVAAYFKKQVLRELNIERLFEQMAALRAKLTDRAILRAIHFFDEDERVAKQLKALKTGDIESFKIHMIDSGRSSSANLQNCYPTDNIIERSISLALALSERVLAGTGAWRIHGGGFAGTIIAVVPDNIKKKYINAMQGAFGQGCAHTLSVRPVGAYVLEERYG